MPTYAQCQELINKNKTTSEWTTINGVNGYKFTNKSDSSKYIFLPAGGLWNNTTHNYAGSSGSYWSTDRYNSTTAWYLSFTSNNVYTGNDNDYRYCGFSVHPVQ